MNPKRIYTSFIAINFLAGIVFSQQDSVNFESKGVEVRAEETPDSISNPQKKAGKFFVGVDLFNVAMSIASDKKGAAAVVSFKTYRKWNTVLEAGFEENHYDELDWNIDVNGIYFKLGFNWFISQDYQDASNGFYAGARFAYAMYEQTVNQYPIRLSANQVDEYGSLSPANVSAYWIEIVGGGRVHLWGNLYADVSVRPEIYLGSKKQEGLDPLIIPGYGKDIGPINFYAFWGLTYKLF